MKRDEEVVRIVSSAVRMLGVHQVAREWWSDTRWGRSRAMRTLHELAVEDLLHVRRVLSRPIEQLKAPLLRWQTQDPTPDFEALSSWLHRRAMKSASMITIVFATRRSVSLFGGDRMPTIKLTQMTHDLHVSEVFLRFRRAGRQDEWCSEDQLSAEWPIRERPDAVLVDDAGDIVRALEYGGDYSPHRLAELHSGFSGVGLNYEIW